jgi:hypothetical protein
MTTGDANDCLGDACDSSVTTGIENTGVGDATNAWVSTGSENTSIGASAGEYLTTGSQNVAVGELALAEPHNKDDGTPAGGNVSGNVAIGYEALGNTYSGYNTCVGYNSCVALSNPNNQEDAFGADALNAATGNENSAFGSSSLASLVTGSGNAAFGYNACKDGVNLSNNTCIGVNSKVANSQSFSIALGNGAAPTHSGQTYIGSPGQTVQTTILGIQSLQVSTIASASTIVPTTPIVHVTGASAISTIVPPQACLDAGFGCQITLIPEGNWYTYTNGNIALAVAALVHTSMTMTYDSGSGEWYPSY